MEFIIDLDQKLEKRYKKLIDFYKNKIKKIGSKLNEIYDTYVSCFDYVLKILVHFNQTKIIYSDELEFWSKQFDMPFHKVLVLQLLYELNSGCTTVVHDHMMYRTMDWPMDFLKEITYHGKFMKNNKIIYEGVCWLGSVGLFTAKTNEYSISINYRRVNEVGIRTLIKNYFNIVNMYFPVSYLVRYVVENELNSHDAIESLKKCNVISPVYYTINRFDDNPLIIQRDPTSFKEYINKNVTQTNCDLSDFSENYDYNDRKNIMNSYERYEQVQRVIDKKVVNKKKIMKTFNESPIMNDETVYFCVISKDIFEIYT
jgi:hypothetical protein